MAGSIPRRSFDSHPANLAFRLVLFVFVAAIAILEVPALRELRTAADPGFRTRNLAVQDVDPDGPNAGAGIEPGDVIRTVDGVAVRNHFHFVHLLATNRNLAPQLYEFERDGNAIERTVSYRRGRTTYQDYAYGAVAFILIAVGLWVYLRRPDTLGSLFAANSAVLAFFLTRRPSVSLPPLQLGFEVFNDAMVLLFPALLLHFFLVFPPRAPRRHRRRAGLRVAAVYAVPGVLFVIGSALAARRFRLQRVDDTVVNTMLAVTLLYFAAYIVGSLLTFVRHYRTSGAAQRQRFRIVIAGALAGLVPFLAITVFRTVIPGPSGIVESAAALCLLFVPMSFAYAILKHGAIELNVVVRKSIVYAFLTGAIIAAYYAIVHAVGNLLVDEFSVSPNALLPVAAVILAMLFAPAREQIQRVVDRLFYRADYVYKQEVLDFNRQLARRVTPEEIYAFFIDRVRSLLKASYVAVYQRSGERRLRLGSHEDAPDGLPASFSLDCFLGRYFTRYPRPLMVEYLDASWERPNLDNESRRFLSTERLAVCVPVSASDRFLGVVLLGEKRSGATYRRADTELLETFAEQLALVLQNAELVQSSLEQERLKSEVMLARDIQLSLLPEEPPRHPDLEVLGQMLSSYEVGGDYFDYFFVDDTRVGFAIGDVSGKGVPAAMLMASLQAVFKNLAVKSRLAPAELNRELNDFLFEHAKVDQFATFFYGIYDFLENTFTFSNAGHCPALLVRNGYTDRLGEGGLVLGIQADQTYREGIVHLEPGNLLLLYTDGVVEQKSPSGDEFGEDRLIDFLRANRNLPAPQLQAALLEEVTGFGAGRQDDDFTNVILRFLGT